MTSEPFKPFLINERSCALLNFIDASQFTESELVDVYLGMCDRLNHLIELKPTMSFEIPTLDEDDDDDDEEDHDDDDYPDFYIHGERFIVKPSESLKEKLSNDDYVDDFA